MNFFLVFILSISTFFFPIAWSVLTKTLLHFPLPILHGFNVGRGKEMKRQLPPQHVAQASTAGRCVHEDCFIVGGREGNNTWKGEGRGSDAARFSSCELLLMLSTTRQTRPTLLALKENRSTIKSLIKKISFTQCWLKVPIFSDLFMLHDSLQSWVR